MKLNMNMKLMMYMIIMTSTMMVISSTNIIMIWLSMELNLFSFIPLLMNKSTTNEIEASITYFLPQALGSTMFFMSNTFILSLHSLMKITMFMMIMAMIMKLGAAPCHFWFPLTMEKISWLNCFILSTWQKIAPLFILMYIIKPSKMNSMVLASLNALIGSMMGLSEISMKKIMAYSSITHMGWILSGMIMNITCLSVTYFILYTIISTPLFISFSKNNINLIHQSWSSSPQMSNMLNMYIIMTLLSLGGMPPLTGFIAKLLMIKVLINYSMMMTIILIFSSLLNLFFYLNISLNMMMSLKQINMNFSKSKKSFNLMNVMMSNSILGIMLFLL